MTNNKKSSAFWPRIDNNDDAENAVKIAGGQYILISVISALLGVLIFKDAIFLIEPFIFGVLSWFLIKNRNLLLSVILALWCLISLLNRSYPNITSLILPVALMGISCNSLRGTFFLFQSKKLNQKL